MLARLDVDLDPSDTGEHVDGRRAAGGRDRQGDVAGRARADHGRADRGAVRARGAAPVPSGRSAQGVGRGGAVHHAPPRRGLRDLRPVSVLPRWAPHLDTADRPTPTRRSSSGRWSDASSVTSSSAPDTQSGEVALSVDDLGRRGVFSGVSFEVRHGEVLGFAGLVGSGRTDVGARPVRHRARRPGEIGSSGRRVTIRSPQDAARPRHRLPLRGSTEARAEHAAIGDGQHLAARPAAATRTGATRRSVSGARDRRTVPRRAVDPHARRSTPRSTTCPAATSRR